MTLLNPAGLFLLLFALPVIALHILRPRRTEQVVSSTFLWERVERPVTATTPWQRLTPSWLLVLQLLAVALLALLVARPATVRETPLADHTVFLIDASASMQALDGSPDRLADARDVALATYDDLPDGGTASVIEVGPVPRVLLTTSVDADEFDDAIGRIRSSGGAADFAAAFAIAESLETPDSPIGFVLIGDGGLSDEELRLVPAGLTYEPVGSMATNRAITDLSVEQRPEGLHASVVVEHTGGPDATQTVRIDVDGATQHTQELSLSRGDRVVVGVDLPAGDRVEAFLDGTDLLGLDDQRWAVTSRRSALDVAVVSGPGGADPFLAAMLASLDGVAVTTSDSFASDHGADLVVFDGSAVPADPGAPFVAFAPPGGVEGIDVIGTVERPVITLVRTNDVLLREVDLTAVGVAESQRVTTRGVDTLVAGESAPLIMRGEQSNRPFLYVGFRPADSNLPVQLAWPILGDRMIAQLGGAALPPTDLLVGEAVRFNGQTATLTDPTGSVTEVVPGELAPVAEIPGWWTIETPGSPAQVVAVNPDTRESSLTPAPAVPSELRTVRPGEDPPQSERLWQPWLIIGLLAVLAIEWMLSRRSVGVSKRQWQISSVVRGAIAAALVLAFFNVGFNRTEDRVATVFLLDASDSLGPAGRAEAIDWVRQALAGQPDDAVAGIVAFGGDARIEALVQEELAFANPSVQIDTSSTDLSAALRLGAAVVPNDARRRLVLVSDGRATRGDVITEAQRVGADDVAIDVVTIGASSSIDAAVVGVDAPGYVRSGEAVPITATVTASEAGDANVSLLRDGEVVSSRVLALDAGTNEIQFNDGDPSLGLVRYEVRVGFSNDQVPQNDRGFAPIQVGESRGVLVVEGEPGGADVFAAALRAADTPVTVVAPAGVGSAADLIAYDSIVLVDVPVLDLAEAQVTAISSAVRDAGRGLLTIGGLQSYGLGGYLGSELESVLPVVSDVLDPQRRQTVAEVLAIDTSGSMGTCHCDEGNSKAFAGQTRTDGGVNKTDISRAAAARTIAALGPNDEIGVLAFDTQNRWVVDLQALPEPQVVADGLGSLFPNGGTDLRGTLETAAEALRESNASLKHIILFSDGFTESNSMQELADLAAGLFDEGITVSVIATGEGAAPDLEPIAIAGGGRFYPGRDLTKIPQIILEEALLASRDYIVEGSFLPQVVSADAAVRGLTESPPLLGYLASTTKPTASTLLRIGPDGDPLLSSWQVGLGTATSWTSDASARWSQSWASWDGYVEFWNTVVRDTFPSPVGDVQSSAQVVGDLLRIEVDSAAAFADSSTGVARLTDPSGVTREVVLDRIGPNTFAAEVAVEGVGTFAIGTLVDQGDAAPAVQGTALASRAYSFEYRTGAPDVELMERVAITTGGRVDPGPEQAFDALDLVAGDRRIDLGPWLLILSALLFPLAVVLSRYSLRRGVVAAAPTAASSNAALQVKRRRADDTPSESSSIAADTRGTVPEFPDAPPVAPGAKPVNPMPPRLPEPPLVDSDSDSGAAAPTATLDALLARKRQRDGSDPS